MEEFEELTTHYVAGVSHTTHHHSLLTSTPAAVICLFSADGGEDSTVPNNSSSLGVVYLRAAPWVVPLLAAAATNAAAIVAFEVYVLVRAAHGTPSRRHLFLGQCLLVGLLLCSLSGLPIALTPTPLSCAATRLLVGVSSALVFAALLVKFVFLISLNSGVYLPAHYQGLLLFFVVLVQVSINIQWQWSQPAGVTVTRDHDTGELHQSCLAPYRHFLLSLIYVIILIISVAALAIKCRGIRENYREAAYIGAALGLVLPLWLAWTLAGLILPPPHQPACLGFGIVATATVVFIVMFIPKGRQLAAVGKEGVFREDQDDQLSTISGGARYSPSFFLFKPIKPPKDLLAPATSLYKTRIPGRYRYGALLPLPHPQPPPPAPYYWPALHYYHHYSQGMSRTDDGVYASIDPPAPHFTLSGNPNFYLFRSHAHTGMMY
ncbi:probable metabotropic glutamate receptor mgl-1 isoform X2 [Cherax quadricarinatus]|nr:metabotropic glutamate receptor 1-like isoform X2 [Cherax quadricarinatus]